MVAHALLEDHVARLAERLRAVHRRVGVAQQFFGMLVVRPAHRDADARRHEDVAAAVDLHRLAEERLDALGDELHVAGPVDAVQQDRELVAAEPRQHVAGAQAGRELVRDRGQQLVAHEVAKAVVHQLEAVDVDEEDRVAVIAHALGASEHASELLHERRAVREIGQRIMTGGVFETRLRLVPIRDVGLRSGDARGRAVRVAHGDAAAQHPAIRAGGGLNPVFVFEVRRLARQVRAERRAKPFDLVGVHAVQPVEQRVADLVVAEAEHRLPARREVDAVANHVPVPETVVRAGRGERVALLALLEQLQRLAKLAFRLLRELQCLLRLVVQLGDFLRVALLVLETAQIHLVAAERQVDGRNENGEEPLAGAIDDRGADHRDGRADEVAGGAPEKVVVPDADQPLARGQRDRDGDRCRVDEVVRDGRGEQRRRNLRPSEVARAAAAPAEDEAGGLNRQNDRGDVEERAVERIALADVQRRLRHGAGGGDKHRLLRSQQEQRGEIDDVRHRHRRCAAREREAHLERRREARQDDQGNEERPLGDVDVRRAVDEHDGARADDTRDIEPCQQGQRGLFSDGGLRRCRCDGVFGNLHD